MLYRARLRLAIVLALLTLTGCGALPAVTSPATPQPTSAPIAPPTSAPTAGASATSPADDAAMTGMLVATVTAQQPTTATLPLEIHAFPLRQDDPDVRRWAVYSSGSAVDGGKDHFVSIYTAGSDGWELVSTLTVTNPTSVEAGWVEQVTFAPGKTWLAVKGSSGLVGPCCFDLLSFDGAALHSELSYSERNIDLDQIHIGTNPDGQPQISLPVELYKGMDQPRESFTVNFVWDGEKVVQR